jgi:hypothetical protein
MGKGKTMLILDMPMPRACDDCPMLDESGDYPMCRITQETRGYNFNICEKRMDRCPIKGEIIQCKDCKEWTQTAGDDEFALGRCEFLEHDLVMNKGFCAWGRRKDNEAD